MINKIEVNNIIIIMVKTVKPVFHLLRAVLNNDIMVDFGVIIKKLKPFFIIGGKQITLACVDMKYSEFFHDWLLRIEILNGFLITFPYANINPGFFTNRENSNFPVSFHDFFN